ncbi:GNAT family N-acetyltransferase [Promicromonospora sp. NPDC050880]|uniref:GNAT family N-acetyltransferase n=1 Tax=Promicromonospora sp. NPDC050880 TaxID=3364406 RepID=UPI00379B1FEA
MSDESQTEVTVRDNPAKSRFDVLVDGAHAGFSMYKDLDPEAEADPEAGTGTASAGPRIFYHTVVFDQFEGRGLAAILTRTALDTSVRAGHRIVAVCPYVKKWLTTHHDFDDAVEDVRREHLRALA